MYFKQLYDPKLAQYAYMIGCQATGEAIIVDPLRDIDQYYKLAKDEELTVTAAADTHIHADYISGLRAFAEDGVKVYASDEGDASWKYEWLAGSDYPHQLIKDGDTFKIGNIGFEVRHTPGHTPESICFLVTDGAATDEPMGILTGDFVFVGDVGRPDLLETAAGEKGAMKLAAQTLYQSVNGFKELPDYLQVWPAHGAGSACGKALGAVPESTVGYEVRFSPAFHAATSETEFVDFILDGQPEPPLYFGRMKIINKDGPAVLESLPKPQRITVEELVQKKGVILDTRPKHAFMDGNLPGSLLITLDKNFNTIAGSYVNPDRDLYLIIDEDRLEEAVRDLIRVGLDNIKGYSNPEELEESDIQLERIESLTFAEMKGQHRNDHIQVLDVRNATEYADGHLPGSLNIAHTRLADHLDELPKGKELWVHCGSGQRASYATALLARNGYRVKWVDDDFSNWSKNDRE